jgi:ABC-2 type transport system permease protein
MRVIKALWLRGLKSFWRNKIQLIMTVIFPFFFLYVFNSVFQIDNIENPVNYMLAGIVITNVFSTGLSFAAGTITDIVSGFMKEVLVSPVKRVHIALGQLLSAATISVAQGILVLFIGYFIGLRFTSLLTPLLAIAVMALVGIVFSAFGLFLAALIKNAQTYQIVETAITMPLTFLCGAYLPISMLPEALKFVAYLNPMTYTTAFFRAVILEQMGQTTEQLIQSQIAFKFGDFVVTPWVSFGMILVFCVLFLFLSTMVFSKVDFSKTNRTKAAEGDIWAP